MKTQKIVQQFVSVDTYCRPMKWAVIVPCDGVDHVIAQFFSEHDAKFFIEALPPQNLEARKIVKN